MDVENIVVVDGDRWELGCIVIKMSHKKRGLGSCVWFIGRSTPGLSRYIDTPSDHWVSSGLIGPNRSQPYALSAPHFFFLPLNCRPGRWQQERRR